MIFCGVFDGHGPLGHRVSHYIRDHLPAKISKSIKMTQKKKPSRLWDYYPRDASGHMTLAAWERNLVKSFNDLDEDVARDINTDAFSSGATAVTVIQQVL